jgi:hypothetical protein
MVDMEGEVMRVVHHVFGEAGIGTKAVLCSDGKWRKIKV